MPSFSEFVSLVHETQDRQLLEDFLLAITTPKEREALVQRLQIVKRLLAGEPQHRVASDLKVGIATVTRGSKELATGRFKVLRQTNRSDRWA